MPAKPKERPGIQSVEIAARLLQGLIAAGHAVPLKELAQRARLHPGKAHRYLVSLTRTELVEQDPVSGRYGVGPMAIALGLAGLRNVDVVRAASAQLPALRDAVAETVLLALWSPAGPVVFHLEESARPVFMNIRVGSVLPILRSATGRIFAAFLPHERTQALIDAERAADAELARAYDDAAVTRLLEQVRQQRYASVAGDLVPGVNAIAAPLFDQKGRIAGVIGALGRAEELSLERSGRVATALDAAAAEVSRRLGYLDAT